MHSFLHETKTGASKEELRTFFADAKALTDMTAFPKVRTYGDTKTRTGNLIHLKIGVPPVMVNWTSVIPVVAGDNFVDIGIRLPLPFLAWCHVHRIEERADGVYAVDELLFKSIFPSFLTKAFILRPMFRQRERALMKRFPS